MSLLPVTVILSMIVLVYAGQWDLPEICPDDDALCELAIRESNKNQCYQYEISTLCCNRCKSLRDNTKADTCPYGDYVDHISVGSGNLLTCDFIKTSGNCDPCQSSRLGRQNCCQTCEEVCGSVPNKRGHTNRLSDLIRELKSLIDK